MFVGLIGRDSWGRRDEFREEAPKLKGLAAKRTKEIACRKAAGKEGGRREEVGWDLGAPVMR
jgi:hypothetical protein